MAVLVVVSGTDADIQSKFITYIVSLLFYRPNRPPHSIETLSAAAEKASGIPAHLPNCLLLKDTIRKAQEWLQEAEEIQVRTHMVFYDREEMTRVDLRMTVDDVIISGHRLRPVDGTPL